MNFHHVEASSKLQVATLQHTASGVQAVGILLPRKRWLRISLALLQPDKGPLLLMHCECLMHYRVRSMRRRGPLRFE